MRTLLEQRKRLETEIATAKAALSSMAEETFSNFKQLQECNETIERNVQLIAMIDDHLQFDHRPMWRTK